MLDKLERRIGKYAIKNLIYYILGGYAIGYILYIIDLILGTSIYSFVTLDPALVMKGQVWRLFTWFLTIPQDFSIWLIFMFILYFFIGRSLESTIGTFRYNVYIFSGWLFMTLGAMIVYWVSAAVLGSANAISIDASTYYINLTSFLAFAAIYPQYRVYIFGIIPIKVKWLAIFDIVYLAYDVIAYALMLTPYGAYTLLEAGYTEEYIAYYKAWAVAEIFCIVVALLNFLIFALTNKNLRRRTPKQAYRSTRFQKQYRAGQREASQNASYAQTQSTESKKKAYNPSGSGIVHRCAVCGRTSVDHPELTFRYCSKCAGNHEYCQDHLYTHVHVK